MTTTTAEERAEMRRLCEAYPHASGVMVDRAPLSRILAERDALAEDAQSYASVCTELGIEYVQDQGPSYPGPLDAVLRAIREDRQARDALEARAVAAEAKWQDYEREYIVPCFRWADDAGIDLRALVASTPGHNCVELLVAELRMRAVAAEAEVARLREVMTGAIESAQHGMALGGAGARLGCAAISQTLRAALAKGGA